MDPQVDAPKEFITLTNLIQTQPTCFSASGGTAVNVAALDATKFVFDLCKFFFAFERGYI